MSYGVKLYNKDCIEVMRDHIEDNSLDLVVTSPPYNVDLGNNKYNNRGYDLYIDNKEHWEYIEWLKEIFKSVYGKLKIGGRVCLNIGDGKNGAVPTSNDVIHFMCRDLNYIPMTHIIWNKRQTSHRTAWGSWKSPSSPSFPTPFEHILIFCKDSKKIQYKGDTDLTKEEFIDWSLSLWEFPPETRQKKIGHPAMFPEELPKRLIKMLTYIGATVFDPFMGAGTVGIVCNKLSRNFIGSEISEEYFKICENRLKYKE